MQVKAEKNFRINLRAVMEAKGISQRSLAEKAGVSYPYVNRVLTGLVSPSMERADSLADASGVPLSQLLVAPGEFTIALSAEIHG